MVLISSLRETMSSFTPLASLKSFSGKPASLERTDPIAPEKALTIAASIVALLVWLYEELSLR